VNLANQTFKATGRRKNRIDWLSKLTVLIEYLQTVESDVVQIRHYQTDDAA
jgi:hypothetical protein